MLYSSHEVRDTILSYSVYATAGVVGAFSAQQWLIYLSIVAVLLRIPVDGLRLYRVFKEKSTARVSNDD